jgi:hypothetical protein
VGPIVISGNEQLLMSTTQVASTYLVDIPSYQQGAPGNPTVPCDPEASPVEICPGGSDCPPSGVCPE